MPSESEVTVWHDRGTNYGIISQAISQATAGDPCTPGRLIGRHGGEETLQIC